MSKEFLPHPKLISVIYILCGNQFSPSLAFFKSLLFLYLSLFGFFLPISLLFLVHFEDIMLLFFFCFHSRSHSRIRSRKVFPYSRCAVFMREMQVQTSIRINLVFFWRNAISLSQCNERHIFCGGGRIKMCNKQLGIYVRYETKSSSSGNVDDVDDGAVHKMYFMKLKWVEERKVNFFLRDFWTTVKSLTFLWKFSLVGWCVLFSLRSRISKTYWVSVCAQW